MMGILLQVVRRLSENCDISYYVAAPGAKGLVKSRDFVVVRKWGKRKGLYFSTGMSVKYPNIPPVDKCVRYVVTFLSKAVVKNKI